MRKITVFTGTRAEYGLLYWLLKAIDKDDDLILQLIVTGMHLSPQYGETWREIEADGFTIDAKVEMLLSSNTPVGIVKSIGLGTIGFADALFRLKPDILVVLGDRFETLAIAQAALIMNIPIAHIHGGELTLGAYDNSIRHAITKMSSIHFVAASEYRSRIIQMGEESSNVFNVGAPGIEYISKRDRLSFNELTDSLNIPLTQPFILVTYHPATLDSQLPEVAFEILLEVLHEQRGHHLLFTYPNADNGSYTIIQKLERYCQLNNERAFAVKSLGHTRYLNAISHAEAIVGNSSSGIIEVPSLGIPSVNIGLRQHGRIAAESVIHTDTSYSGIQKAINQALDPSFKDFCKNVVNPYGDGKVASRILSVLKSHKLTTIKQFQDLDYPK